MRSSALLRCIAPTMSVRNLAYGMACQSETQAFPCCARGRGMFPRRSRSCSRLPESRARGNSHHHAGLGQNYSKTQRKAKEGARRQGDTWLYVSYVALGRADVKNGLEILTPALISNTGSLISSPSLYVRYARPLVTSRKGPFDQASRPYLDANRLPVPDFLFA